MYTVSGFMTSIRKKKKRIESLEESLEESMVERRTKKLANQETYLSFRMLGGFSGPSNAGDFLLYNSLAARVYYRFFVSLYIQYLYMQMGSLKRLW
jgi:hypothetical protein